MEQTVMNSLGYPILSALIFLPAFGALSILILERKHEAMAKWAALAFSLLTLGLSIPLYTHFDKTTYAMQFVEARKWIPAWNINYALGVDGISVLFVLLSALLGPLCVLVSWNAI